MSEQQLIAAVDLGSNSFRLQVARVVDDQIYPLDGLKETVRLGAGLDARGAIDAATQTRALACLQRFNERLRDLPRASVRAVGTNTFRAAKSAKSFLKAAEAALGFPIDVIAGREEARLIYIGVSHSLPASNAQRLVVDIGGGSTEFIIGQGLEPQRMESLYMGCVSYTQRFFPDGKISKSALQEAELTARSEMQSVLAEFSAGNWQEAVGSSGTARALADILQQSGWADGGITAEGLQRLRSVLIKAGSAKAVALPGLQVDRIAVLPGGFAVMAAVFDELQIERMTVAEGALREGVLYDLLGRVHHVDQRDATVTRFMRRYQVDTQQAERVERLALALYGQVRSVLGGDDEEIRHLLCWMARLHEVGWSIAHAGYHKHSAYILANADMPGFSKTEQARLALLARAHRGSLAKLVRDYTIDERDWELIAILRLATLFCRSRRDADIAPIHYSREGAVMRIEIEPRWLAENPLTETLLKQEQKEWKSSGGELQVSFIPAG